jgi:squalene-hopene/tetraprenyl-beta-curcumene cyclase
MKTPAATILASALLASVLLAACLRLGDPSPQPSPATGEGAASRPEDPSPLPDPGAGEIRQAVERTLPYLEEHGVAWIDKFQCTSCHQVPVMIWTYHAAAERGLEVDGGKLDEWDGWVLADVRGKNSNNSDGMAQLILGRPAATDARSSEYAGLANLVAGHQRGDGSWHAGGQLPDQRRPQEETHRVSTAWAVLALASVDEPGEVLGRGRARVEEWLDEDGESHEWLVVRLLYVHRFGDEARERDLLARLLEEQHADGGWGWLRGEASDAFATGQGLYALALLGRPSDDPAVLRARRFLVDTQEADGSWAVRSTLEDGEGVTPTSRYWGTGWAAIGLLSTL